MDTIFIIFSLGFVATIFSVILKDSAVPVLAIMISLVTGLMILIIVVPSIKSIFSTVIDLSKTGAIGSEYIILAIKVVGISYLGEFVAEICRDAGQGSIAKKIEFGVKVAIVVMSLPLLNAIISSIIDLLE